MLPSRQGLAINTTAVGSVIKVVALQIARHKPRRMAAVAQPSGLLEQLLGGASDVEGEVRGGRCTPLIAPASSLRQAPNAPCPARPPWRRASPRAHCRRRCKRWTCGGKRCAAPPAATALNRRCRASLPAASQDHCLICVLNHTPPAIPRPGQVLLTLYATVAERYAGDEAGDEEGTEAAEGGAARPAAAAAGPTIEELEAAAAFSSSLAALAAQEEAAGQGGGAISQLAALAAQHAAVLQAMHETAQLAASVRVAAELQQRLADFDAAYAAGSYSEAAWIAVELQKGVAAVPGVQRMGVVQRELQAVLVPCLAAAAGRRW